LVEGGRKKRRRAEGEWPKGLAPPPKVQKSRAASHAEAKGPPGYHSDERAAGVPWARA